MHATPKPKNTYDVPACILPLATWFASDFMDTNHIPRTNTAITLALAEQTAGPLVAECTKLERENIALREGMAALESMQTDPTASKIAKHYLGLYPANGPDEPRA